MITEIYALIQSLFTLENATAATQSFLDLVALIVSVTILITCIALLFKMFFSLCRILFRR